MGRSLVFRGIALAFFLVFFGSVVMATAPPRTENVFANGFTAGIGFLVISAIVFGALGLVHRDRRRYLSISGLFGFVNVRIGMRSILFGPLDGRGSHVMNNGSIGLIFGFARRPFNWWALVNRASSLSNAFGVNRGPGFALTC